MTDAERRPLMLGESPSKSGDRYWQFPLSGAVARTMCRAAGWDPDGPASRLGSWTWALYARFECRNVFERHRHATPWSAPRARARWEEIVQDESLAWPVVVCLGRRVQAAVLGHNETPYHEWTHNVFGVGFVTIPHPSGLNRLLNDPAERAMLGQTLRFAAADPMLLDA